MIRVSGQVMMIIGIGMLLAAAAGLPVHAANQIPADWLKPTMTAAPAGNILFHDDFETYSNRWTMIDSPKASTHYFEGVLRARIVSPGVAVWSVPDFEVSLSNYRLEVDAELLDGGTDSLFGFVLDYEDDEDFYAFITMLNGEWLFLHQDSGEWIDLTETETDLADEDVEAAESAPETEEIVEFHLAVEVIDGSLSLYLDDQLVGSMTGESLSDGLFGLFARAGKGFADVAFDNMVVTDLGGAK